MAQIEIDIDDFLNNLDNYEIEEVIEWLDERNELDQFRDDIDEAKYLKLPETGTIQDEVWNEGITKLLNNRMGLSIEDEQTILKITSKFI